MKSLTSQKPLMQFSKASFNRFFNQKTLAEYDLDDEFFEGYTSKPEIDSKFHSIKEEEEPNNDIWSQHVFNITQLIQHAHKREQLEPQLSKLCSEFGIQYGYLCSLKNQEEMEDYVLKASIQSIHDTMITFTQKKNFKELRAKREWNQECERVNKNSCVLDLFGWLQVKCQYEKLKERLKFRLVEEINEQQDSIIQFFGSEKNEKKEEPKVVSRSHRRLMSTSPQSVASMSDIHSLGYHSQRNQEKLRIEIKGKEEKVNESFIEWNTAIERGFIGQRGESQSRLTKEISSCSWTSNGMYPLIYENNKKKGVGVINVLQRKEAMERYAEGETLSQEELKFLANTSLLLNKYTDKRFVQRAVNYLDGEIKEQIELSIAEEILKNYYGQLEKLKQKRLNFIEDMNKIKRVRNFHDGVKLKKKMESLAKQGQLKRMKEKMIAIIKGQQQQNRRKQLERRTRKDPLQNFYVLKFKEKMMEVVRRIRKRESKSSEPTSRIPLYSQTYTQRKTLFHVNKVPCTSEQIKRKFHPSSKVFIKPSQEKEQKRQAKYEEALKYKLGIRNYNSEEDNFRQFYSGGPHSKRQFNSHRLKIPDNDVDPSLPQKHPWISAKIEEEAANKIKAAYKGFIQRKKYLAYKESKRKRIQHSFENKLKKYLDAKHLFDAMGKQLNKTTQWKRNTLHESTQSFSNALAQKRFTSFAGNIAKSIDLKNKRSSFAYKMHKRTHNISDPNTPTPVQTPCLVSSIHSTLNQRLDEPSPKLFKNLEQRVLSEIELMKSAEKQSKKFKHQKEMNDNKLKHRKLLTSAKMKSLSQALSAGFRYNAEDVNCRDDENNTPLYYSAMLGDEAFCRYLLDLKANVNVACSNGDTPLHMAFKTKDPNIIVMMLHSGGDLNRVNDQGHTPIAYGSEELLRSLNLHEQVANVRDVWWREHDNNELYYKNFERESGEEGQLEWDAKKKNKLF